MMRVYNDVGIVFVSTKPEETGLTWLFVALQLLVRRWDGVSLDTDMDLVVVLELTSKRNVSLSFFSSSRCNSLK